MHSGKSFLFNEKILTIFRSLSKLFPFILGVLLYKELKEGGIQYKAYNSHQIIDGQHQLLFDPTRNIYDEKSAAPIGIALLTFYHFKDHKRC